ncbi:MAG TPA: hypothetical protein VGS79_07770 [Puia sp.]|nr:hypothetical protein [Puia sp.]
MATGDEIKSFLQDFKAKLEIWGVIFRDDRGKNAQAILDLDIAPIYRVQVLRELQIADYHEGPKRENLYGGADMWIFGKAIKGQEVYIKITLGFAGAQVICISFHIAEHPMKSSKK